MIFNYDYYKNLEDVDFYLCNPDGEELFPIAAQNANFALRFNDISTLSFEINGSAVDTNGDKIAAEYYDLIQTRRQIYVKNIGWFVIRSVVNNDNGYEDIKTVEAESLQSVFKDRGCVSEERVYCIYNTNDPFDAAYDSSDESAIPSVVGQMYQQLGINQDLVSSETTIESAYDDWTIIHVDDILKYHGDRKASDVLFRTMQDETKPGYDWLVNDVEEAFGIIIDFDFLLRTITIKTVANATEMSDVCLSFANIMNTVEVTEDANDLVTILNCTGNDIDITEVNPTGTNYIANFDYYMDKVEHKWMSNDLIKVLEDWKTACNTKKSSYESTVQKLYDSYKSKSEYEAKLQQISLELKDLKAARDNYSLTIISGGTFDYLKGIVAVETVDIGENSIYDKSIFYDSSRPNLVPIAPDASKKKKTFETNSVISRYAKSSMTKNGVSYSTTSKTFSLKEPIYSSATVEDISLDAQNKVFFFDNSLQKSYCALNYSVKRITESDTGEVSTHYICSGFTRYITLDIDELTNWINRKEKLVSLYNNEIKIIDSDIKRYTSTLNGISDSLNLLKYVGRYIFADGAIHKSNKELLRELSAYWIEGDYANENISSYESATQAELITLSNELLEAGRAELEKVSQPRYTFSIGAESAIGSYELKDVVDGLVLGNIITTERKDGVWYYPALLEMSFTLGDDSSLTLSFANALKLDDWGYTFADLVTNSANTSRKVSANWQNLMEYARDKQSLEPLIKNPLDATLRASFSNMTNQEFQVDSTGILGRRKIVNTDGIESFDKEQVRLINNVILFTKDNWHTASAALGKISYTSGGATKTTYGLIADTLVGNLILGEAMKIINGDKSITMDADGIRITNGSNTMFSANSKTGNLSIRGTIYALKGEIGGWTIDSDCIGNYGGEVKDTYFFSSSGLDAGVNALGYVKKPCALYYKGNFAVDTSGKLYAKDATIEGKITATDGTFNGTVNATSGIFNGTVYATGGIFNGTVYAKNGSFSGRLNVGSLYIGNTQVTMGSWLNNKGKVNYIEADSGFLGLGDGASWRIGNARLEPRIDTIFPVLYCSSSWYPTPEATRKTSANVYLSPYLVQAAEGSGGITTTWYKICTVAGAFGSDRRIKKKIHTINEEKYDKVFDSLTAKSFVFNELSGIKDGGKQHIGFIAQEVKSAFNKNGMRNAGIVEKQGYYTLKYTEIIPLNTWQIQKLKKRVSELEKKVKVLEDKEHEFIRSN